MTGRGNPKNAINQRTAPSEKNQNSSPVQRRCATVARANAVKNVWLRTAQIGRRKTARMNLTHFVGTVIADGPTGARFLGTTSGTTLARRDRLRRRVIDFRLVAATDLFHGRVARFPRFVEERLSGGRKMCTGARFAHAQLPLGPAHVGAGPSIDFDRFALSDKERHVDRFTGFELCRFSHVTGGVPPHTLGRLNHFEIDR